MTREERNVAIANIAAELESLAVQYNDANIEERFKDKEDIDKRMTELVTEYSSLAMEDTFENCKEQDDPMLAAVTQMLYSVKAVKDVKTKDDPIGTRVVYDKDKKIDLRKLDKYCGGIGHDASWTAMIERFNRLMTLRTAKELGIDAKEISDTYAMSRAAREFAMDENAASNTKILKTLNAIIEAMLGEGYKGNSHDVNYLIKVYCKKSKALLSVTCSNHKYMTEHMADICHRIVTGGTYGVEYKAEKR